MNDSRLYYDINVLSIHSGYNISRFKTTVLYQKLLRFLEHSQFSWYAKMNALARFRVSLHKLYHASDKSISLSFILISYVNIYIILSET